jgi:hypothetical protein
MLVLLSAVCNALSIAATDDLEVEVVKRKITCG